MPIDLFNASSDGEFDIIFEVIANARPDALLIAGDPLFNSRSRRFAELTLQHRIPAMFQFRQFLVLGGLVSYAGSITDAYRVAGAYTGRILAGEKPSELPVRQSARIELVINLHKARALGIDVLATVLARADEVIE